MAKIAVGKIQSTKNSNRMRDGEEEKERERVTGRRERIQLKLAQFSHSPVIRMPGIYIIKSRKFLSSLYPYHFCMRALVQLFYPACPISYFTFSTLCFPRVFSARPNVVGHDYRRRQGSNPRFRSELRLITLIARVSRLYYSLFNHAL